MIPHFQQRSLANHRFGDFSWWDLLALTIIVTLLLSLGLWITQATSAYRIGDTLPISTELRILPTYALYSTLRMLAALLFSLLFALIVGTLAAKSILAQRVIIPLIDILQAVPILGFLPLGVYGFMTLFPGSMLGPEMAAIFAIFTSQAWNIMLSFYQSLLTVPIALREACRVSGLSAWQIFWRLEVPYAMPGLLWNTMLSLSAGWFFVVAAEAISIADRHILLPGIGSFIATALQQGNRQAIIFCIIQMFMVIIIYDQCLLRPTQYWIGQRQHYDGLDQSLSKPWLVSMLVHTQWLQALGSFVAKIRDGISRLKRLTQKQTWTVPKLVLPQKSKQKFIWLTIGVLALWLVNQWPFFWRAYGSHVDMKTMFHIVCLGSLTALRVMLLVLLCLVIWVPIGVFIGMRPKLAATLGPWIQLMASLPVNLFYPLLFYMIIHYHLNVEIWTAPLMMLGMQWYILFNVIAGASKIDPSYIDVVDGFGLRGIKRWRFFLLPAILPDIITGAMTAAGGAWNASIIAEVVQWQSTVIKATGLGAYIASAAENGEFVALTTAIIVMCCFVLAINQMVWKPLYQYVCVAKQGDDS